MNKDFKKEEYDKKFNETLIEFNLNIPGGTNILQELIAKYRSCKSMDEIIASCTQAVGAERAGDLFNRLGVLNQLLVEYASYKH